MTIICRPDGKEVARIDTRGAYVNVLWSYASHEPLEPETAEELARGLLATVKAARRTQRRVRRTR